MAQERAGIDTGMAHVLYKNEIDADTEGEKNNKYPSLTNYMTWRRGYDRDPRFRGMNRRRECHSYYNHFFQCQWVMNDRGDSLEPCEWFRKQFMHTCDVLITRRWDEWRADGLWWGKLYEGMEKNASPSVNRTTTHMERYEELMKNPRYLAVKDQL